MINKKDYVLPKNRQGKKHQLKIGLENINNPNVRGGC